MHIPSPTQHLLQTSLEITILGSVDERVHAAVAEYCDDCEVVERAAKVSGMANEVKEYEHLLMIETMKRVDISIVYLAKNVSGIMK